MSETAETCPLHQGNLEFNDEQRKFLKLLLKKSKAKLIAEVKKSQQDSCTSIFNLLNQIVFDICSEIIDKSEKPKSCMEKVLSCGGKDGTEFLEVINDMQEKGLLEAMMKQAEAELGKITTNPQLEMKKFTNELFEMMDKFTKVKEEPCVKEAPEEAAPVQEEAEE